jgi:F0F1-type ATP synthase alpha subunit
MSGELVEFESQGGTVMGQVMTLESDTVGAALFGDATGVREGDTDRSTG